MPLLWPYAWLAFATTCLSIGLAMPPKLKLKREAALACVFFSKRDMAHRLSNAVVIPSAIAAILIAVQQTTHVLPGSGKSFTRDRERCYGVVRAGRNDCGTAKHACAGRAARDAQSDEWRMLPGRRSCMQVVTPDEKSPGPFRPRTFIDDRCTKPAPRERPAYRVMPACDGAPAPVPAGPRLLLPR
jgi:uncharacterized membrane protein